MSALVTVEVNPLGRRGRFSVTPAQQNTYRALAERAFRLGVLDFRLCDLSRETGIGKSVAHSHCKGLIERGWVEKRGYGYALTEPVMSFRKFSGAA